MEPFLFSPGQLSISPVPGAVDSKIWGGLSQVRVDWRFLVLAVLMAVFLAAGYITDKNVMAAVKELQDLAQGIEAAVLKDNWTYAHQLVDAFFHRWPPVRRTWDLIMDRDEMDQFDLSLARLQRCTSQQDKNGALAELAELRTLLIHVEQKEVFRWRNLL